jgi:dipeptidyl aminopeptidase/acylaminoacyl peptidase
MANRLARSGSFILLILASPLGIGAQEKYRDPSPAIVRILDAPPTPTVVLSPDRTKFLMLERPALPPIWEVAAPELRLAGDRINPRTSAQSRGPSFSALIVQPIVRGETRRLVIPWKAKISSAMWSPDGHRVAYTLIQDGGVSLWVADAYSGETRMLSGPVLNGAFGNPCRWLPAGTGLVCSRIPANRPAAAPIQLAPTGPAVQESDGGIAANPTYEDLLKSAEDEALFEHYFTSQIVLLPLTGTEQVVGSPGLYQDVQISPDGRFLLVQTLHRPFSYLVPASRFPTRTEVWDLAGNVVKMVSDRGLQDNIPRSADAVGTGPRSISWRNDVPATLVWVEAQDGGNPAAAAKVRDRVVMLDAPFSSAPVTLAELEFRSRGVVWGRGDLAVLSEGWSKTRRARTWIVNPSRPGSDPRLLFERSSEDRYSDPGRFVTAPGLYQAPVLMLSKDGKFAYLVGEGASADGDRPFIDRLEIVSGRKLRLFQSDPPFYEEVVGVADADLGRLITRRESLTDPPNHYVRDLKKKGAQQLTQLTRFYDTAPEFAAVTKQRITYTRGDGVRLSATLYLPPGYDKSKGPLPFLFWAYPQEFRSAQAASQTIGSPYRFTRPSGASHLFLLMQGYGVLDGPTMPIVGEGDKEPNDTYVEQLIASAQAAVEKVVSLGVADPKRIGVGGHSYGAFMTANLLAHSDLFRAGIARSGAYNRSLTPFGFQNEDRSYWEAQELYSRMSPFNYANRIKEPLLLIHGMADDNTGTFPIQSERMYAALKGTGTKARLVMLPAEAHGYRARESIGHTLFEMTSWMDRYVKETGAALTP